MDHRFIKQWVLRKNAYSFFFKHDFWAIILFPLGCLDVFKLWCFDLWNCRFYLCIYGFTLLPCYTTIPCSHRSIVSVNIYVIWLSLASNGNFEYSREKLICFLFFHIWNRYWMQKKKWKGEATSNSNPRQFLLVLPFHNLRFHLKIMVLILHFLHPGWMWM